MGDSKEIKAELEAKVLSSLETNFKSDPKNLVAQNAVGKHGINAACHAHHCSSSVARPHVFNHAVEETKPVTNQKGSGRCWIFALLNTIRIPFVKKYNLKSFEFSQPYLYFWNKIELCNYLMEIFIQTAKEEVDGRLMMFLLKTPCQDGGQWDMLVNIVEKYGLLPKEYWPESASTESSGNFTNLLAAKLREACRDIHKLAAEGKDINELRKTKQKYITDVYQICSICLGTPPATFDWEYKDSKDKYFCHANVTPLQFYEQFVKPVFNMSDKVCLINDPRVGHDYYKLYTVQYLGNRIEGYPVRYINVPIDVLKKTAAETIKSKEAVWFGCDVGKSFHKQGILDFNTCDYQLVFNINPKTLDKGERLEYGESMMTHAMVLTAVSEKQEGIYTKWRIENSWGSDSGKDGYLMMTDEWFSEYVYEVVVDKRLVTAEVLDVLKQEPVVLPPWDPMGSLA